MVAVVGSGGVGRAIAGRLAAAGRAVTFGVRDPGAPDVADALAQVGGGVTAATVAEAIEGADAVVVAIPGAAVPGFLAEHGARLADRLAVDASNDLSGGHAGSLHHLPEWAALAPGAQVARAFCTVGWENMADPDFDGTAASMFWCGPDGAAGDAVADLIRATGMDPVRVGGTAEADLLDGIARLWFRLAMGEGLGRRIAFRLLRG